MKVSLLTGGASPHYVLGLLSGLISKEICVDFIGNDEMQNAPFVKNRNVNYLNLRGDQNPNVSTKEKVFRVMRYYLKLVKYAIQTDSKLFHIQWFNKFVHFDRTFLNIFYKLLGKKLLLTAHNINQEERDESDSYLNRLTLKFMYNIVDHIIVHTNKMKLQLMDSFKIRDEKISVISHGIMSVVPKTNLNGVQARKKLRLQRHQKVLLFFGYIAPYKGLDHLVMSLAHLKEVSSDFRLIIAGEVKNCEGYWEKIQNMVVEHNLKSTLIEKIGYIPDEDVEIYFKAADVLILPYVSIFESGLLFLAFHFGLPVIATNVGSFKEEINDGITGFICDAENPNDLSDKIRYYFQSQLYKELDIKRMEIIERASKKYSWNRIADVTSKVYKNLILSHQKNKTRSLESKTI